eukprot:scaffold13.g161.t1
MTPPAHSSAAILVAQSLYYPALFVLPLYASRDGLPRSHPTCVWRRMAASLAATAAGAWIPTYLRLASAFGRVSLMGNQWDGGEEVAWGNGVGEAPTAGELLPALGLRREGLRTACTLPLLLTATLYAGPLVMLALDATAAPGGAAVALDGGAALSLVQRLHADPAPLRNYVAAPMAEEACFRAGLLSALLLGGAPPAAAVWLSPLAFGAAHLHHWHDLVSHQGWERWRATAATAFQFGYTLVFGWYAAFLMLRTGHLAAPTLCHAFCNAMGFPRFAAVGAYPERWQRLAAGAALAAGVAGFAALALPLTASRRYGWRAGASWATWLGRLGRRGS